MSDFGSVIAVCKTDRSQFSEAEKKEIIALFASVKEEGDYEDMMGEELKFDLMGDEPLELVFMFSEYWYGDGDDEEIFEFAKENDFDQVEEIAELISAKIDGLYLIEADFVEW